MLCLRNVISVVGRVAVFAVSVDFLICGLAPLGEYLVILFYDEQPTQDVCPISLLYLCSFVVKNVQNVLHKLLNG